MRISIRNCGLVRVGTGQRDTCDAWHERCFFRRPGFVLRAEALLLLGRVNEVQKEVDRAVQLAMAAHDTPRLTSAYLYAVYAAEAALMRGEDAQAYEFAQHAVSERPSIPSPHAVLAAIGSRSRRAH